LLIIALTFPTLCTESATETELSKTSESQVFKQRKRGTSEGKVTWL